MSLLKFVKPKWPQATLQISGTRQLVTSTISLVGSPLLVSILTVIYFASTGALFTWAWQDASCLIEESKFTQDQYFPNHYNLFAKVQYQHQGNTIQAQSTKAAGLSFNTAEIDTAKALYKPGTHTRCFVEPRRKEFILGRNRETEWNTLIVAVLLVPSILLCHLSQATAIWSYIFSRFKTQPIVEIRHSSVHSKKLRRDLFTSLFAAALAVVTISGVTEGGDYFAEINSKDWQPASCNVLLKSKKTSPDMVLKELLVYEYMLNGKIYRSSHVKPFGVGSLSEEKKQTIEQLNVGDTVECWIDRSKPYFAKLTPATPTSFYESFKFTIWALLIGIFVLWLVTLQMKCRYPELRFKSSSKGYISKIAQWFPLHRFLSCKKDRHYILSSRKRAWKTLLLLIINGVFCVGMITLAVSVFSGNTGLMLLISGIAILLAFALFSHFQRRSLAIRSALGASPNVEIVFQKERVRLGEDAEIEWRFSPKKDFNSLRIVIKAKERFNDGSIEHPERYYQLDSKKEKSKKQSKGKIIEHEFFNQEILNETLSTDVSVGRSRFFLPKNVPHSILSPHFAALWVLDVTATRNGEEQLVASFDLDVFPQGYLEHTK